MLNPALLIEPEEIRLYLVLKRIIKKQDEAISRGDWLAAMMALID